MNVDVEKISTDLFKIIANRYHNVSMFDEDGKGTLDESQARLFNMMFLPDQKNSLVTISLLKLPDLEVTFDRNMISTFDEQQRKEWFRFISRDLRRFTVDKGVNLNIIDIDKPTLSKADISSMIQKAKKTKEQELSESRFSKLRGTKMSSVQTLERHRIKIKHSSVINDDVRGSRSRRVKALYIENNLNERIRFPFLSLEGVRAMARHLEEGGHWDDQLGKHILEAAKNLVTIRKFVREARRQRCTENILPILEQLREKQNSYRRSLMLISGAKGYHSYKTNIEECYVEPVPSIQGYFATVNPSIAVFIPQIERILGEKPVNTLDQQILREYVNWVNQNTLFEAPPPAHSTSSASSTSSAGSAPNPPADSTSTPAQQMPSLQKPSNLNDGKVVTLTPNILRSLKIVDAASLWMGLDRETKNKIETAATRNQFSMPIIKRTERGDYFFDVEDPLQRAKLLWLVSKFPKEIAKMRVVVIPVTDDEEYDTSTLSGRLKQKGSRFARGYRKGIEGFGKVADVLKNPDDAIKRFTS